VAKRTLSLVQLLIPAVALEAVYTIVLRTGNLKEHAVRFILLALGAGILYLISAWLVCRGPRSKVPAAAGPKSEEESKVRNPEGAERRVIWFVLAAGLVFRATLFPLYPSLSDDLFRYRWDGKMQAAGYNPYQQAPADPALKHLRDETWPGVNGKNYVAVYGPLTELLFRWWYPVAAAGGGVVGSRQEAGGRTPHTGDRLLPPASRLLPPKGIQASVLLMKLPMLAFDLGVALLLLRLLAVLGLPAARVLIYWWSPITVVEFAASGHNDSVAVFFLVLALIGLAASERAWTLAALALSTLSKLFAGFLWPMVLVRWIGRGRWKELAWPVVCAAVVYFPFRGGLFGDVQGVSVYAGSWRNNDSLFGLFAAFTGSPLAASAAYGATVAGIAGFLAGRGVPALRSAFVVLGAVLCCASNVFPWYMSWILPLLAVFPNPAWLLFSVLIFLSYNVLIGYGALGVWRDDTTFLLLEYVPFYALLIGGWMASQSKAAAANSKTTAN
jgi:alpha-1,6-mannosyltransferase